MSAAPARVRRRPRVPFAQVAAAGAPAFLRAERLGGDRDASRRRLAVLLALLIHSVLTLMAFLGDREHGPNPPSRSIPVLVQRLPPPVIPQAQPPAPQPRRHTPLPRAAPPPAAAQAARVVAAPPAPEAPLDLQNFSMPVGTSQSYAGGFTAPSGTSATAVASSAAQAHGVVGGTGTGPGSLARAATPARQDWSCAWPDEEQSSDLRDARVMLKVHVDRDGHAQSVDVSTSPSPSFAQAARACARSELFRSARDDAGRSVPGATPAFVVHFVR